MPQPVLDPEALDAFVRAFRDATGHVGEVGEFAFADTPEVQTELARLVLEDDKRATAGLHGTPDEPTTTVGQHDVVLDGTGAPVCLVCNEEVRTLPFGERDPAFAVDTLVDFERFSVWCGPNSTNPHPSSSADGSSSVPCARPTGPGSGR